MHCALYIRTHLYMPHTPFSQNPLFYPYTPRYSWYARLCSPYAPRISGYVEAIYLLNCFCLDCPHYALIGKTNFRRLRRHVPWFLCFTPKNTTNVAYGKAHTTKAKSIGLEPITHNRGQCCRCDLCLKILCMLKLIDQILRQRCTGLPSVVLMPISLPPNQKLRLSLAMIFSATYCSFVSLLASNAAIISSDRLDTGS